MVLPLPRKHLFFAKVSDGVEMGKTDAKSVTFYMVEALNQHVIECQEADWKNNAVWRGRAGARVRGSLKHFKEGWQRPPAGTLKSSGVSGHRKWT